MRSAQTTQTCISFKHEWHATTILVSINSTYHRLYYSLCECAEYAINLSIKPTAFEWMPNTRLQWQTNAMCALLISQCANIILLSPLCAVLGMMVYNVCRFERPLRWFFSSRPIFLSTTPIVGPSNYFRVYLKIKSKYLRGFEHETPSKLCYEYSDCANQS